MRQPPLEDLDFEEADGRTADATITGEATTNYEEWSHRLATTSDSAHRMPLAREIGVLIHKGIVEAGNTIDHGPRTDAWYQRFTGARMHEVSDFTKLKAATAQLALEADDRRMARNTPPPPPPGPRGWPTFNGTPPPRPQPPRPLALNPAPVAIPLGPAPLTPAQRGRQGGVATASKPRNAMSRSERKDPGRQAVQAAMRNSLGHTEVGEDDTPWWER